MKEALVEAIEILEDEVRRLRSWSHEAETGGWSTIHVRPMRARAKVLLRKLSKLRSKLKEEG